MAVMENLVTLKIASSAEAKTAVFRMRYDALKKTGWIGPKSGRYIKSSAVEDKYDHYPPSHSRIFTIHENDEMVGSVRPCCQLWTADTPQYPLPSYDRFSEDLNRVIPLNTWVAGISKLIVFTDGGQSLRVLYSLLSCVAYMLERSNSDSLVATVMPRHTGFYRRIGLDAITEQKPEHELEHETLLLHGSVPKRFQEIITRYPQFHSGLPQEAEEW